MPEDVVEQELLLPRIYQTNPILGVGTQSARNPPLPRRSSALERLEGKEGLHGLPPKTPLVAAEPVNELIVEVHQAQVAKRDVTRGTRRALATFGYKFLSAAIG